MQSSGVLIIESCQFKQGSFPVDEVNVINKSKKHFPTPTDSCESASPEMMTAGH